VAAIMGVKEDVLLSLVQGPIAEAWANSWAKKNRGWVRDSDLDGTSLLLVVFRYSRCLVVV